MYLNQIMFFPTVFLLLFCKIALIEAKNDFENPLVKHVEKFSKLGREQKPVSDKVTEHSYYTMYGMFLVPMQLALQHTDLKMKMLEIGLGCGMNYGPGASVALWKTLFENSVELWEAEYNKACVDASREKGQLAGINVVTGDQGNVTVLNRWIKESGGKFHVIIDDGGHRNSQIKTSFDVLFEKALLPGGLYFIEDLQVGRHEEWGSLDKSGPMTDIIHSWIEQLIIPNGGGGHILKGPTTPNKYVADMRVKWPIPPSINFILCQREACVISKKK